MNSFIDMIFSRIKRLSINGKVLVITLGVVLLLLVFSVLIIDLITRSSFDRIENRWVKETSDRLQLMVRLEQDAMLRTVYDYAVWNDSYDFMKSPSEAYLHSNVTPDVVKNLQLSGVFYFQPGGRRQIGAVPSEDKTQILEAPAEWDELLSNTVKTVMQTKGERFTGIITGNGTPYLLVAHGIFPNDALGPPDGVLIHLRRINGNLMSKFSAMMGFPVSISPTAPDKALSEARAMRTLDHYTVKHPSDITIGSVFRDIDDKPALVLDVSVRRDIHMQGDFARLVFFIVLLALICSAGILWAVLLKKLMMTRLANMIRSVVDIRVTLDLSKRLDAGQWDEIDTLAADINLMLDAIEKERASRAKAEREKEAMQEYLLQVKKMEAIGTMAGGIAHDFNNMLVGILGSTELLKSELPQGSPLLEHAARIEKAGTGAAALVRRMLTMSRGYRPVKTYFSVSQTIHDMLDMLRAALPPESEITIDKDGSDDIICADITHFQQTIVNLASNSAQAMADCTSPSVGIRVSETLLPDPDSRPEEKSLPAGRYVRITFRDCGTGIPESVRTRIFEPFFSTRDVGSGTGLGLSVAHKFVMTAGGAIAAGNADGGGAVFHICLPAAQDLTSEPVRGDGISVLLVDDDLLVLKTVSRGLSKLGYSVIEADGSASALAIFEKQSDRVQIVITDQMMPGMNGQQMSREIKAVRPGLPIILMSGFASGLEESSEGDIFARILMKPVTIDLLSRVISDVLSHTAGAAGGRPR